MRVRRLTNWCPPDGGMICVGDVHEIDEAVGARQLACGDVEIVDKDTPLTPAGPLTSTETAAPAALDDDDEEGPDQTTTTQIAGPQRRRRS